MVIKETRSDKIFNFINYFLLACVFLICLYPLWFIIIASISNPDLVNGGQVWFWPKDISFDGYKSKIKYYSNSDETMPRKSTLRLLEFTLDKEN